jgi:hypothetical protein
MTAREQFEQEHFNISPAKVGKRYHAAAAWGPSAWRKTLKYWTALALGIVLGAIGAGVLSVVAGLA